MNGSKLNEAVHVDYFFMGDSTHGNLKYLLSIVDYLSSFVWLSLTLPATNEVASDALSSWVATFASFEWLVSDHGSHSSNQLFS